MGSAYGNDEASTFVLSTNSLATAGRYTWRTYPRWFLLLFTVGVIYQHGPTHPQCNRRSCGQSLPSLPLFYIFFKSSVEQSYIMEENPSSKASMQHSLVSPRGRNAVPQAHGILPWAVRLRQWCPVRQQNLKPRRFR